MHLHMSMLNYYYENRENIHLGVKCYGTNLTDYNELVV